MKIAMVSEHASPLAVLGGVDAGGQNVHVAALATALGRRGHRVTVFTRRDDPGLPARMPFAPGVEVDHVDAGPPEPLAKDHLLPHMEGFARHLERCWRHDPPDLVHAHFWMSGLAALRAARGRLPVIQTFHALGTVKRRHQGAADSSPPERLALEREVALRATGIVATCRDETTELRSLGVDPGRVRIVPCGVDLELFRPEGPVHERTGAPRVVVVTRLVERKGVAEVIRAVATLSGVELLVAGGPRREELGSDPEARRLRELASALGIGDRFHLLGRLDRREVPALIRSADAVACCPWYEPFGIVPLEAMACGVPVVGSAVGGLLDTVLDGVTGVLVPPRQPQAIAEALAPLLADAPLRARYGAAGAVRAHVGYGWDRVAAATASSYRALRAAAARRMVGPAAPLDDAAALPREDGLRLSEARSTT